MATSAKKRFLTYGRQNIDRADIEAVIAVLESDWITQGPQIERLEAALAERTGARFAVAVSSGTAALHIACLAAGLGRGDRGLTAAITFAASANCLLYAGGSANFVDIDRETLGMAPSALAVALRAQPETKAVIPVHMAGLADAAAQIRKLAGNRVIIEDAAHSLGGTYDCGKAIGCCAYSDMTTLSFHPVKQITTGEGGAVLTNDAELARRLRLLRSHGIERDASRFVGSDVRDDGRVKPWIGEQQILGFNYRITDISAALGLSQLEKLDRFIARRRAIARRYDEAFRKFSTVRLPQSASEHRARSAHHLYVAWFDLAALGTTRSAFMAELAERGVGSQVHYAPVYYHPFHSGTPPIDRNAFPEAEDYYRGCLSLPLHPGLTDEEVERVVAAVVDSVDAT